jgi:hypothetical protein
MRKRLSEPEARVGPRHRGPRMTGGASRLTWQLAAINATASGLSAPSLPGARDREGRWAHLSLARGDGLVDLICLLEEVVEVWGLRRGRRNTTRA